MSAAGLSCLSKRGLGFPGTPVCARRRSGGCPHDWFGSEERGAMSLLRGGAARWRKSRRPSLFASDSQDMRLLLNALCASSEEHTNYATKRVTNTLSRGVFWAKSNPDNNHICVTYIFLSVSEASRYEVCSRPGHARRKTREGNMESLYRGPLHLLRSCAQLSLTRVAITRHAFAFSFCPSPIGAVCWSFSRQIFALSSRG